MHDNKERNKNSLEMFIVFIYKSSELFCYVYIHVGAAPILHVQDTIFNLPNCYLGSSTVFLDGQLGMTGQMCWFRIISLLLECN